MSLHGWKTKNWRSLIHSIHCGNCILVIGADASRREVDGKRIPLEVLLANQLADELEQDIQEEINTSNLEEVCQKYVQDINLGRNDLEAVTRAFYVEHQSVMTQALNDLATLPFYFIITTTFDSILFEALKKNNKAPLKKRYHFKGKNPQFNQIGSPQKPLLYYLHGAVEESDSLVLSENDLLDFLVSIISRNPLPDRIISEINIKNKNFLFFGFGFKHWYHRILLHVLQQQEKENRSFALEQMIAQQPKEFNSTVHFFQECSSKIHIYSDDLTAFAGELRQRYEDTFTNRQGRQPDEKCNPSVTLREDPEEEIAQKPAVFLCHANEDKDFAAQLFKSLKDEGFNPWLDREKLKVGDQWDRNIKKALKEVDYFMVLQSKALANKLEGYVNKEIFEALERQKEFRFGIRFIIPISIEECKPLEILEHLQGVNLASDAGFDQLITTLRRDLKKRGKE